jgi:hypothetical protein
LKKLLAEDHQQHRIFYHKFCINILSLSITFGKPKPVLTAMKWICIFFLSYLSLPLNAQIITTVAGNGTVGFSGVGGPAASAHLHDPQSVCSDNAGNIYVADLGNHVVWKINSSNIISIFAGTGIVGSSGDGGPADAAKIGFPYGVCSDNAGNIYITDQYNGTVRKVGVNGNISTIAGNGSFGYLGDGGPATDAELSSPCAICVDKFGNVFFADFGNQTIRKINSSGIISTVAGNGMIGNFGNGGLATEAMLNSPTGVSVDNAGNIYIADMGNSCIRKVDAAGIITTFAGSDSIGYSGDGGPGTSAELKYPYFVYVDENGNVYISDTGNGVLRLVNNAGTISTIAGDGTLGYSGDGGPAASASFIAIAGICIDNGGNIYIADATAMKEIGYSAKRFGGVGRTNASDSGLPAGRKVVLDFLFLLHQGKRKDITQTLVLKNQYKRPGQGKRNYTIKYFQPVCNINAEQVVRLKKKIDYEIHSGNFYLCIGNRCLP